MADVNYDGWLDLLVVSAQNNQVSLRLGDGRGNFSSTIRSVAPGDTPQLLALGDFNRDGVLDLVTAYQNVNYSLLVSLGSAGATFGLGAQVSSGTPVGSLHVGDVNGDGNQDLVFTLVRPSGPASSTLTVRLGNGLGNFAPGPELSLTPGAAVQHLQDLNNDGRLDCLIGDPAGGTLSTYLGTGQASFVALANSALTVGSTGALGSDLADFNGDGVLDLAVPGPLGVQVHAGTGQGTFGTGAAPLAPANVLRVNSADFNGDGILDLLGIGATGEVSQWLGLAGGGFQASTQVATQSQYAATGDLNGDGALDLVLANGGVGGSSPSVKVRLNQALANAPTITGFTPAGGSPGSPVTVSGTNFQGATTVLFGGRPVPFTLTPAGTIVLNASSTSPINLITVITPNGTATSATGFGILASARDARVLPASVYPNPARYQAHVQLPVGTSRVRVGLDNQLGQRVRTLHLSPAANGLVTLELKGLVPGLYTLRLETGKQAAAQQIVVE